MKFKKIVLTTSIIIGYVKNIIWLEGISIILLILVLKGGINNE